jgi:hypothetical protein
MTTGTTTTAGVTTGATNGATTTGAANTTDARTTGGGTTTTRVTVAMIADATKPQIERFQYIEPPIPGLARRSPRCDRSFAKPTEIGALFDPPVADEREAARRMLAAVRPQSGRLDQVREAFKRPGAVWMVEWNRYSFDESDQSVLPGIAGSQLGLRKYADFCAEEALLQIVIGEAPAAAENIHTLFDLQRMVLNSKPSLLSVLIFQVFLDQSLELIWEGALRAVWTDAQLAEFDGKLRDFDPQRAAFEDHRELGFGLGDRGGGRQK